MAAVITAAGFWLLLTRRLCMGAGELKQCERESRRGLPRVLFEVSPENILRPGVTRWVAVWRRSRLFEDRQRPEARRCA
jgi:hypothetical protein